MPFIPQDKRGIIDPILDEAWAKIEVEYDRKDWPLEQAGNLAYIVYRLMLLALRAAGTTGWGSLTRVWSDVALGAAAYFKHYEIDPYEEDKFQENGPVILQYPYDDDIPF